MYTPEQWAMIMKHHRMPVPTWFGVILSRVGIPGKWFPRRWWLRRLEELPDYAQYMERIEAEKRKSGSDPF